MDKVKEEIQKRRLKIDSFKMNKQKLINLVNDLYWDYDRMSSSGQETLDKISDLLGIKEETENKEGEI